MRQFHFIRSNTFLWALAVAAAFALFVVGLFAFIYWKIDDYLIVRSDRMITTQIDFLARLPSARRVNAITDHLEQDSRGVQYAGLFDVAGARLAGNIQRVPQELELDGVVQGVRLDRITQSTDHDPVVRAAARRLEGGAILVMGRNVDETREISSVVGQALALGLLPAFCLCLLAGACLSIRAQRRVEEVNQRVRRIVAGDLRERLPQDNVDDPFARLAGIVNGMLDEMETMINALTGVGNDIAHDLRTPLTRARLALERGRTHAATLEQLHEVVDKAVAGIDQSLAIVTALLRLAEIENNRRMAGFGDVALDEILREVCDVYEPIAEDKNVALGVAIDRKVQVWGDRDLLFETVANLVDNAVKFTPAGGMVRLELVSTDKTAFVRVSDTGLGINEQEREAVLRRFYRSDKMRHTPGVGLGLSLVAAIVKLHGFRLIIYPPPGGRVEILVSTGAKGPRPSTSRSRVTRGLTGRDVGGDAWLANGESRDA
ncbi:MULTISPECIES: sensor histidine kinase [Bradyrhizobium]|uniref:histidine kinase n=1 Tax=Bradyrhizobium ottawaense TaxID=931866 RepID=A0ABV4G0Q6_9BRAD|nr:MULTISPECIES: HAMP domain-containing sensor histidine kinase [Bradyrhizobium]MBR1289885.1 HAMP domain-containing histidine kinase [Bradyrhizobium ottawaense]PDT68288.1 sensor histidine kinase [Bradyrhizobium ottawaense]WLB48943.1 HAMP domain-containing sensor histidine kinase [Bradyrhizobium ottawaense]WQN86265.1 HAMP domain-containing sensor histidine kinase [Bradyrhizobium ottawaense]BBO05278.1 two-component sensor histidine kinase [Bradyrhizobium ottawaense]